MTDEKLKEYFEIYTDCWKLFRKYSEPNDTDEFWQQLIDESKLLHVKHGKTEFSKKLLVETITEIERIFKERKE